MAQGMVSTIEQLLHVPLNQYWAWLMILGATFYGVYHIWSRLISRQGLPKDIDWARPSHNVFERAGISLSSLLDLKSLLMEGYENYSKKEKPFLLPNIVTGHEVILPVSQMRWLLDQPDDVLSQHDFNKAFLCADYTMLHDKIIGEANMGDFIRRNLTRELDIFAGPVVHEIKQSLEDLWGRDTSVYQEISVYNVMLEIIGRLVNRVFVGLPLCRDARYLQSSTAFAQYAIVWGGIISLFPTWVRPFIAPFWTAYDKFQFWKLRQVLGKIVRERISNFEDSMILGKPNQVQPNDFIHWALVEAYRTGDASEKTVDMITKRLAVFTFAAVQSSAITITNALFAIASSPDSFNVQEELRLEAERMGIGAPAENPRAWARSSLAQMTFTDSLLRETLRLGSFVSHGVTKVVKAKGGVTLPSGHHIPQGTKCGIASYGPQHDSKVYDNPYTWNPFRFCQQPTSAPPSPSSRTSLIEEKQSPKSFVTTSDYLMGFSHGKHACPGRFFASQQLKLLLAHIALDYDIEPIEVRPINRWLNNSIGPPVGSNLRVRRRLPRHQVQQEQVQTSLQQQQQPHCAYAATSRTIEATCVHTTAPSAEEIIHEQEKALRLLKSEEHGSNKLTGDNGIGQPVEVSAVERARNVCRLSALLSPRTNSAEMRALC